MTLPSKHSSTWDQDRDELSVAARSAAKRVRGLVSVADQKQASEVYRRAAERAADMLDDAAESLNNPAHPIRWLTFDPAGARAVARSMTAAQAPHATQCTPPATLLSEQQSMSVLTGSTSAVPMPDLLEFLAMLKKTGILWVKAAGETFTLQLEDGALVHASSSVSPIGSRLGDVLVKLGHVSEPRLTAFLRDFSRWSGKLGIALEKAGLVTSDQLVEGLEQQVRLLFQRLFALENASFSFTERKSSSAENRLRLDITHLLLESARVSDEARNPS